MELLIAYIGSMLLWAVQLYSWLVIVYIILCWVVNDRRAGWFVFLEELVEPVLAWIRKLTRNRLVIERFDLSPLLLFLIIRLVEVGLQWVFF